MSIAKHILLTGGTGVLGRELVSRLLRHHPGAQLTLLLRPDRNGLPEERLASLRTSLAENDASFAFDRLDAVAGDVGSERLGLNADEGRELRESVTHVIHAAATTRLDAPKAMAWRVNFEGTLRALAFADSCRNLDLFAHVSTAYVCGDREGLVLESDLWEDQGFLNHYEESKCGAEIHVRTLFEQLPVTVFRPSIIVGESRTGRISSFASLYSPLRHIAQGALRVIPAAAEACLDLIPVDYVADAIARLTARSCAAGETYHLCAGPGRRVELGHLVAEAIRIAGDDTGPAPRFDPSASAATSSEALERLDVFFDYLRFDREFSIARTQAHLGADKVSLPGDFLTPMFEFCRQTDWGRSPAWEEVAA